MKRSLSLFVAPLAAAASLTGACAYAADDAVVRYGDLDLSAEAGRAALESRIAAAARVACSTQVYRQPLPGSAEACRKKVHAEAMEKLPPAELTKLKMAEATRMASRSR